MFDKPTSLYHCEIHKKGSLQEKSTKRDHYKSLNKTRFLRILGFIYSATLKIAYLVLGTVLPKGLIGEHRFTLH